MSTMSVNLAKGKTEYMVFHDKRLKELRFREGVVRETSEYRYLGFDIASKKGLPKVSTRSMIESAKRGSEAVLHCLGVNLVFHP